MARRFRSAGLRLTLLAMTVLIGGALAFAADSPTTAPAMIPLGNASGFQFTPPPPDGWDPIKQQSPTIASYISKKHNAVLALQVLPPRVVIDQNYGELVVKQLKGAHAQKKEKMVMEPTIESDGRFALFVRERFEVGAKAGQTAEAKVAEQLHIYRNVGPRVVECTINTVADDADVIKSQQAAAEDALVSAAPINAAAARKPATRPTR
jgi:hypothetical protein